MAATAAGACCSSASAPASGPRWWSTGHLHPLEIAHLQYRNGKTYEEFVGKRGLERMGKKRWRGMVAEIVPRLYDAFQVDEVVLGGGNVKQSEGAAAGHAAR